MTWTKRWWVHKGRLSQFLPLAWNCPVNELRGPLGLEGKACWQSIVPPEKTHVDNLTFKLMDWFLSFYSRCWRIPASNMEIILWVSKMKISSEVFSRPAFWTIFAVDLVHIQIPSSQPYTSKFLVLLRRYIGQKIERALSPGQDPWEPAAMTHLGMLRLKKKKKDGYSDSLTFFSTLLVSFPFLFPSILVSFLPFFPQLVIKGKYVDFHELCSWLFIL